MTNVRVGNRTGNVGAGAPDWEKWRKYGAAPLWQVVALACNLDPENPSVKWFAVTHLREPDRYRDPAYDEDYARYLRNILPAARKQFRDGLDIAASHVRSGDLQTSAGSVNGNVRIGDFVRWAETVVGWTLPPEFRSPLAAEQGLGRKPEKEIDTRERTSLLVMVGALAEMAKLDITKPTPAAKKILSVLESKGVQLGKKTIEEHLKRVSDALDRKGW